MNRALPAGLGPVVSVADFPAGHGVFHAADVGAGMLQPGTEPELDALADVNAILEENAGEIVARVVAHHALDAPRRERAIGAEIIAGGINPVAIIARAIGQVTDGCFAAELEKRAIGIHVEVL